MNLGPSRKGGGCWVDKAVQVMMTRAGGVLIRGKAGAPSGQCFGGQAGWLLLLQVGQVFGVSPSKNPDRKQV